MTHEDVEYEVEDDGGILFSVQKSKSGDLSVQTRVYGRVVIDGKVYEYDRNVRVKLKRSKE